MWKPLDAILDFIVWGPGKFKAWVKRLFRRDTDYLE